MLKTWEEGKAEARAEGRVEGRLEVHTDAVVTLLRVRGIAVPQVTRERILAERDIERLQRWHEKAIVASSIEEMLDDVR